MHARVPGPRWLIRHGGPSKQQCPDSRMLCHEKCPWTNTFLKAGAQEFSELLPLQGLSEALAGQDVYATQAAVE